jgi:2,6-dihydroxypyridine 3-monooxygenase
LSGFPSVAVIGGSLGGLTAALVLRDLGCRVDVFERSGTALEARGAGIGLHPMTTRYFDESSRLDAAKVEIELPWLRFLGARGETVYQERMGYRFSSWNTLYRGLLGCFDRDRYHLGAEVAGFGQDAHGVTLRLADGASHRADMLVCADGISSASRARLLPGVRPRYAGYVAWRATLPEAALSAHAFQSLRDALTYCLLPAGHVLVYPIPSLDGDLEPGRRLANLVWYHNYAEGAELDDLMTGRDGTRHGLSLPPGTAREQHVAWTKTFAREHMAPAIAEVVLKTREPFVQVIHDIEIPHMAFGRVCLVGDAAFGVRPHAAAGTAKACADAWTLRDALCEAGGDPAAALTAWEPGQLALGRQLLARTRDMGERSQFHHSWVPGDPSLRLGLYGPGR